VVLDVEAQDSAGRLFNNEMQISIHPVIELKTKLAELQGRVRSRLGC